MEVPIFVNRFRESQLRGTPSGSATLSNPFLGWNTMPALKNPRHEAFAQAVARGMSASAAYVEAGYKANRHNAAAAVVAC